MSLDIDVLRALLRLARRRTPATAADLLARVDASEPELVRILARLEKAELAYRDGGGVRLSLGGLAVAAASVAPVGPGRRSKPAHARAASAASNDTRAPAAVLPLLRRHRAA
jgi:DNA-binding IclR family transcriptional regulator